jgi:hypothetical protein
MSRIDEQELLRRIKLAAQMKQTPEAIRRTNDQVRLVLKKEMYGKGPFSLKRISLPAGVAAGILLVVGVLYISLFPKPATAAERLKEVIKTNKAFKGWIRISASYTTGPNEKSPRTENGTIHVNTVDGTVIIDRQTGGNRQVEYENPLRGEHLEYESKTNQIRIGTMASITSDYLIKEMKDYPARLDAYLDRLKDSTGVHPVTVRQVEEGQFERFDINFSKPEKEYLNTPYSPRRMTVWVDPETRLIRRTSTDQEGRREELNYRYGEPAIRDLYDLGVPREAKIVDNRPRQDIKTIFDRLDARYNKGLGDYVAVLTNINQDPTGKPGSRAGNLTLFAQNGQAWSTMRYVFVTADLEKKKFKGMQKIIVPQGWEGSDVKDLIERGKDVAPWGFLVHDGHRTWGGTFDHRTNSYFPNAGEIKGISLQLLPMSKARESLPGMLWLNKNNYDFYGPTAKVELFTDSSRPGKIGIRGSTLIQRSPTVSQREEKIFWIDPGRDDLPVETIIRDYRPDGKTIETENKTLYLDYSQLPTGQWYPAHWRGITKGKYPRTSEYRLLIAPNLKLAPFWFTNPVERFKFSKGQNP